jgi:hypothetical protein
LIVARKKPGRPLLTLLFGGNVETLVLVGAAILGFSLGWFVAFPLLVRLIDRLNNLGF